MLKKMKQNLFLKIFRVVLTLSILFSGCLAGKIPFIYAQERGAEFFECDASEVREHAQEKISYENSVLLNAFSLSEVPFLLSYQDLTLTVSGNPGSSAFFYKSFNHSPPILT